MKILQVGITLPEIGGAERHIFEVVTNLSKNHFVILMTQKAKRPLNFLKAKIVEIPCIKGNIYIRNLTFSLFSFPYLFKTLYLKRPDIVHIHFGIFQGFLGIVVKLLKRPLVFTNHGFRGWKIARYRLTRFIARILLNFSDKIICVSPTIMRDLKEIGVNSEKLIYIPNGINLKEFKVRKRKISRNIVFFGRLDKQKGVHYLIEAFKKISEEYKNLKLIIIGDGPEKKYFKKLAKGFKNIIFTGYLERDKLLRYLTSAYVIVLPSIYEGFPLAVLEAMASGRPVITTNLESIKKVIKRGIITVKVGDVNGLKAKIVSLIKNMKKANTIGRRGRQIARQYEWGLISRKIIQVYESVKKRI